MANGLVQGKAMEVPSEELLIEWPEGGKGLWKYWLSNFPPQRKGISGNHPHVD